METPFAGDGRHVVVVRGRKVERLRDSLLQHDVRHRTTTRRIRSPLLDDGAAKTRDLTSCVPTWVSQPVRCVVGIFTVAARGVIDPRNRIAAIVVVMRDCPLVNRALDVALDELERALNLRSSRSFAGVEPRLHGRRYESCQLDAARGCLPAVVPRNREPTIDVMLHSSPPLPPPRPRRSGKQPRERRPAKPRPLQAAPSAGC